MKIAKTKKPVRLLVCGAAGRMGTRIIDLAGRDARFRLIAGVERASAALHRTAADGRTPIITNIGEMLEEADAVIDFTSTDAVVRTAERVARAGKALVIGTTGVPAAGVARLKGFAKRIPLVFSPNMSIGVNVLFRVIDEVARALASYDIEIVEAHHNQKKDAPSGTAARLAEIAAKAAGRSERDFVYGRKGLVGPRTKREIGISVVRAGDIVGDHTVYFGGPGERLELTHRAHSRDAFASGALEAAYWAAGRRPGFYSMADVLGLEGK